MIYGAFADVYDRLMDDYDYDAWAERYMKLFCGPGFPDRPVHAAECACGTGSLTVRFARAGCRMTGIDASQAMLRIEEEQARRNGVDIQLVCSDMRNFRLTKPTDAVLATCDGINYLLGETDVCAFFRSARRALRPGGFLCFDFSTRFKLEELIGDRFEGEERDGLAYLWQNRLDPERHILTMDLTCFVREEDGRYRRFRETHRQRAHSMDEIAGWLEKCGFSDTEAFGEMRGDGPKPQDTRIHVRASAV